MTQDLDFKAALESLDACRCWYDDKLGVERTQTIETALRIADRLQSGEVSEGLFDVCPHIESSDMKL